MIRAGSGLIRVGRDDLGYIRSSSRRGRLVIEAEKKEKIEAASNGSGPSSGDSHG